MPLYNPSVTEVFGTTNRITVSTGTTTPVIDISATFEALLGKVANPLSQFAATTSAQLRGVLSDENGSGVALFDSSTSATFITPILGTPTSVTLTNATGLPLTTGITGVLPIANGGTAAATTSQNFAFIGPTSGSGAPSFRALVAGDIPSLSGTYLPLAGGTMSGSILTNANNTLDLGASGTGFRTAYLGTSLVAPLIVGGSGTTQTITYQTTSGVGAAGASHIFLVGNNGATTAMTITNAGLVGIGTTTPSTGKLVVNTTTVASGISVLNTKTSGTIYGIDAGASGGTTTAIGAYLYASGATTNYAINIPSGSPSAGANNYAIRSDATAQSYFAGNVGIGVTSPTAVLHLKAGTATASTAPLKLTTGTSLTTAEAGVMEYTDPLLYFTPTGTVRGVVMVSKSSRATAQTAANASVFTYTLPATDASFMVSANVLITTATLFNFLVQIDYTDEGNTARTETFNFSTIGGVISTILTNATGTVPYESLPLHIRCKASTAITIKTANGGGTNFTTVTYNVEGNIRQIA